MSKFDLVIAPFKKYNKKVNVADLKQYLVDEFNLTNQLDAENKKLYKEIENFKDMETEYNATLAILDEYKRRLHKKNEEIKELKEEKSNMKEDYRKLKEEYNELKIDYKQKERYINKIDKESIKKVKSKLISLIKEHKGTLSKDKMVKLVNSIKEVADNEE